MRFYVLARTAIFIALGATLKASLSWLPNVELVTWWVYVNTMLYGFFYGAFIGVASNIVSDIFFTGFGTWTIFTSLAFALVALFFHVWSGNKISLASFFLLASVSSLFLLTLAFMGGDSLAMVVGWGFFFLGMSAFAFRFGLTIVKKMSDSQKKWAWLFFRLLFGLFIIFVLKDFFTFRFALAFFCLWVGALFFWKNVSRFIGKKLLLGGTFEIISRNKGVALAALIATMLWDVFTVVTMSVMLFGQPLAAALYAQYGIIPPTFYPFGIVHTLNNMLVIALLGERAISLVRNAERHYL